MGERLIGGESNTYVQTPWFATVALLAQQAFVHHPESKPLNPKRRIPLAFSQRGRRERFGGEMSYIF
jgi:hypothetical protein